MQGVGCEVHSKILEGTPCTGLVDYVGGAGEEGIMVLPVAWSVWLEKKFRPIKL